MTTIDQFESVFKASDKPGFAYEHKHIRSVLVISDMDADESEAFAGRVRSFLGVLEGTDPPQWKDICGASFSTVQHLIKQVRQLNPDLVCTYRNLCEPAEEFPYSLGVHVDVLTQATSIPVLLLPHPKDIPSGALSGTRSVMAITDHLAGDHRLVNYASSLTIAGGTLVLTHVEDEQTFQRYLDAISKIPSIDTESARDEILEQLFKEPRDYIRSCREVVKAESLDLSVDEIVTIGHSMADYRRLVEEHSIDLLVMNTKDQDQLAMHGVAYPLSVELRDTPLLLL